MMRLTRSVTTREHNKNLRRVVFHLDWRYREWRKNLVKVLPVEQQKIHSRMKFSIMDNRSHSTLLLFYSMILYCCVVVVVAESNNIYTASSITMFNQALNNKNIQMLYATVKPKTVQSGFTKESAEVYVVVWPSLLFIKRMCEIVFYKYSLNSNSI
jgi:hypothetical protein